MSGARVSSSDDPDQQAAMSRLRDLVSQGDLSVDGFSTAMDQVLAATDFGSLEAAMTPLPAPVRITPPSLRLAHVLRVDAGAGHVALGRGWQLAAVTEVRCSSGRCDLDLTQATWDATCIELRLHADWGSIDVVVPEGIAVQVVSAQGSLDLAGLKPPLPAAPQLHIMTTGGGSVRVGHPRSPRLQHMRQRLRRRLRR